MASVHRNKKVCKYGESCYRKNEDHLKNFTHDASDESAENGKQGTSDEDIENKAGRETTKNAKGTKRGRQAISEKTKNEEEEPVAKKAEPEKSVEAKKEETVEKDQLVDKFDLEQVKDLKEFVFEHNSMHMPEDFYSFLEFCKQMDPKDPKSRSRQLFLQRFSKAYDHFPYRQTL